MKEDNKLAIHNYWKLLVVCHSGLIEAIFMFSLAIFVKPNNNRDIFAVVMFCLLGILGISIWVYGICRYLNYLVVFKENDVIFYKRRKAVKSLCVDEIKRIIVYTVPLRGSKLTEAIIIDDGTFSIYKDVTYPFSKKAVIKERWIVIQYSWKRLQMIKAILPNCPIEEIDSTGWND